MRFLLFIALFLSFTLANALSIQHVSHKPKNIPQNYRGSVIVRFNLDQPASVALKVYDDREYLIRTIHSNKQLAAGDNSLIWDVKDSSGKYVPNEAYHYTLEAKNASGNVVYDVTDLLSTNKNTIKAIKWDREKGEVSYVLVNDSRVNIRAGIGDGGPLLTTVINWLPRKRGAHTEFWNGYDKNKRFNISQIPRAEIFTDAYTFASNNIIVGDDIAISEYVDKVDSTGARKKQVNTNVTLDQARKKAEDRADYNLVIKLPETNQFKNDLPIYKGKVPVKLSVSKEDLTRMSRDRFEPILFVDGQYVSEIETGFFPVTWQLDTNTLTTGEHFITINIRGYDGQYGSVSKSIYIEK